MRFERVPKHIFLGLEPRPEQTTLQMMKYGLKEKKNGRNSVEFNKVWMNEQMNK